MLATSILCVFSFLIASSAAADTSIEQVVAAFNAADIPTDANITFSPTVLLEVTFPQANGSSVSVTAGEQLPRNATAIPPVFGVNTTGDILNPGSGPFVVAMIDLDAPTPQDPTSAEIRHFLGGDFVLSNDSTDGLELLSNTTPAISNFLQPTPPAGSDPHRYVFLLFAQPAGFDNQTLVTTNTSISNFDIATFAATLQMGNPLGGSFMLVGPDPNTTVTSSAVAAPTAQ